MLSSGISAHLACNFGSPEQLAGFFPFIADDREKVIPALTRLHRIGFCYASIDGLTIAGPFLLVATLLGLLDKGNVHFH